MRTLATQVPSYSSERVSKEPLLVNNCGEQRLCGHEYDTLRKNGRMDYAFQYISRGIGYYEENGVYYPVEPGHVILYFPGVRQHYVFHKEDETLLLWTHFTGELCALLDPLKSEKAVVVRIGPVQEFEMTFRKLILAHFLKESYSDMICQAHLYMLLALLMKSMDLSRMRNGYSAEGLDRVINHMLQHFDEPLDLDRYAAMCYVSRSRFSHLFKDRFGVSPYHCLMRIRLDRAAEILSSTSISVSACAEMVGFQDCSYFCRIFKKFKGQTPLSVKKMQY